MISKTPFEGLKVKFDVVSAFVEHDGDILLLHRQDHKPQGDTWGVPAGKVDAKESLASAIAREVREEIGVDRAPEAYSFCKSYYVRHADYYFNYHIFKIVLDKKPTIDLNLSEHKDYRWLKPTEALKTDLIEDEDSCIKWTYEIK